VNWKIIIISSILKI